VTTAGVSALIAVLMLGFVEGMRRFYPAKATWIRLRSRHGRRAVRAMRERFEAAASSRVPRLLAGGLMVLVVAWVAAAPALDALPYAFVSLAFVRVPNALRSMAARIRDYEKDSGEDPDKDLDDYGNGDPSSIAL
jgi:hypothetical protein